MSKYVYKVEKKKNLRKIFRFSGLGLILVGFLFGLYSFYPIIAWQIFIKPAFANFASPVPQATILTKETIESLLTNSFNNGSWLPESRTHNSVDVSSYAISIEKLKIKNATVVTTDTDIGKHLVHFPGTSLPPFRGNAVIFGHSTLPQLFNPTDYKTIFARAHELKIGDKISVTIKDVNYTYKIFNITIVDADDLSYLAQPQDDSYLTIVTCTPPGTIWKRLIIKANVEKI